MPYLLLIGGEQPICLAGSVCQNIPYHVIVFASQLCPAPSSQAYRVVARLLSSIGEMIDDCEAGATWLICALVIFGCIMAYAPLHIFPPVPCLFSQIEMKGSFCPCCVAFSDCNIYLVIVDKVM